MQEKVYFKDSNGFNVCAMQSIPEESDSMVIMAHGFSTGKSNSKFLAFEKVLNENKIATLRFDFFGHGESQGEFADITVSKAVDDILSAVEFVKSKGFSKIGLIGSSFGGLASIIAGSKLENLKFISLICPVSDWKALQIQRRGVQGIENWKKAGFATYVTGEGVEKRLNYSLFEDIEGNNGQVHAEKISAPTLIVHGNSDELVPLEQSLQLSKIIKNSKLAIVEGADHKFSEKIHFAELSGLVCAFAVKNML